MPCPKNNKPEDGPINNHHRRRTRRPRRKVSSTFVPAKCPDGAVEVVSQQPKVIPRETKTSTDVIIEKYKRSIVHFVDKFGTVTYEQLTFFAERPDGLALPKFNAVLDGSFSRFVDALTKAFVGSDIHITALESGDIEFCNCKGNNAKSVVTVSDPIVKQRCRTNLFYDVEQIIWRNKQFLLNINMLFDQNVLHCLTRCLEMFIIPNQILLLASEAKKYLNARFEKHHLQHVADDLFAASVVSVSRYLELRVEDSLIYFASSLADEPDGEVYYMGTDETFWSGIMNELIAK